MALAYRNMSFCEENPTEDFYIYMSIQDLDLKVTNKPSVNFKCRTLGILQSINGRFYLKDIDTHSNPDSPKFLISMIYLTTKIPSTVIPYAAQLFGTVQYSQPPVLYANILQVLNPKVAISLQKSLMSIMSRHMAQHQADEEVENT